MKKSFTMAEILLSMTIIGVIAAITLPSLTGNVTERTYFTQKKALYSRLSQAIALMGPLSGYGEFQGTWANDVVTPTVDTAANIFVRKGLSKVLKLNNICDNDHFKDCGITSKITTITGTKVDFPKKMSELNPMFTSTYRHPNGISSYVNDQKDIDTKAIAFETHNGESVVAFYNPYCEPDFDDINAHYVETKMCANFVYDLNGPKGPNMVGKDIGFLSVLYPNSSIVVSAVPLNTNATQANNGRRTFAQAQTYCDNERQGARLPNRDELASMFFNMRLLGLNDGVFFSGEMQKDSNGTELPWVMTFKTGRRMLWSDLSAQRDVWCVRDFGE